MSTRFSTTPAGGRGARRRGVSALVIVAAVVGATALGIPTAASEPSRGPAPALSASALPPDAVTGLWDAWGVKESMAITGGPTSFQVVYNKLSGGCPKPPGTLQATFSGSGPVYTGSWQMWWTNGCGPAIIPSATFTLSADSKTLDICISGQGCLAFTRPAPVAKKVGIGNASVVEGRSGGRLLRFTVSLSAPSVSPVTVPYTTVAGTATAGSDFVAKSGTVSIPAGATSAIVSINVKGDTTVEPKETFTVKLGAPTGAKLARANGVGTIINDDPPASGVRVSIGDASVLEGQSATRLVRLTVSLSQPSGSPVTVKYATVAGTATAVSDFVAKSGTVSIPAGATYALVTVAVKGNTAVEPSETFKVQLSAPTGATFGRGTGTGTILNDD